MAMLLYFILFLVFTSATYVNTNSDHRNGNRESGGTLIKIIKIISEGSGWFGNGGEKWSSGMGGEVGNQSKGNGKGNGSENESKNDGGGSSEGGRQSESGEKQGDGGGNTQTSVGGAQDDQDEKMINADGGKSRGKEQSSGCIHSHRSGSNIFGSFQSHRTGGIRLSENIGLGCGICDHSYGNVKIIRVITQSPFGGGRYYRWHPYLGWI